MSPPVTIAPPGRLSHPMDSTHQWIQRIACRPVVPQSNNALWIGSDHFPIICDLGWGRAGPQRTENRLTQGSLGRRAATRQQKRFYCWTDIASVYWSYVRTSSESVVDEFDRLLPRSLRASDWGLPERLKNAVRFLLLRSTTDVGPSAR